MPLSITPIYSDYETGLSVSHTQGNQLLAIEKKKDLIEFLRFYLPAHSYIIPEFKTVGFEIAIKAPTAKVKWLKLVSISSLLKYTQVEIENKIEVFSSNDFKAIIEYLELKLEEF